MTTISWHPHSCSSSPSPPVGGAEEESELLLSKAYCKNQPRSQSPGMRNQPRSQSPGMRNQPRSQSPGMRNQPPSQSPGMRNQPRSQSPGMRNQPPSQSPGMRLTAGIMLTRCSSVQLVMTFCHSSCSGPTLTSIHSNPCLGPVCRVFLEHRSPPSIPAPPRSSWQSRAGSAISYP